jgi:hypothetical protein
MGEVFRYVSDGAFAAHRHAGLPCGICEREGDVFYIHAHVVEADGSESPISEACVDCIRRLDPAHVTPWWETEKRLPAQLRATPGAGGDERAVRERAAAITAELRRTPALPRFIQRDDWPFCCGDLAEYTGEPSRADAAALDREGQYWDRGPAPPPPDPAAALVPSGKLQVLGGVSAFRCPRCGKGYWTFQCT